MGSASLPVIEVTVEPRSGADRAKLEAALAELSAEDATFSVSHDRESDQFILKGASETHLDAKVDELRSRRGLDISVGAPQVAYRETITREGTVDYTHKKQSGAVREFARVKMKLVPGVRDSALLFESKIVRGTVPEEYVPAVITGICGAARSGILAGFPVVDLKVELLDGAYHDTDSSAETFEIAAGMAMREGLRKCGSTLLEPLMRVEITVPAYSARTVTVDLRSRRGRILRSERQGETVVIEAIVGLANLFGYASNLRAMSQGLGSFTMSYDSYDVILPPEDDPPAAPVVALFP
jgi:elongation factor G